MGENSRISWTDHTFNPWIGCARVSAGCLHCYAEARDHRYGEGLWGTTAPRRVTSDSNWRQPVVWNRDAERLGERAFVFCASLADVFEDRPDLVAPRARLFDLIEATPHLVWMLLTKRPENILKLTDPWVLWPRNVWIGTTVEDERAALERIPVLMRIDQAPVRFLSCEPLLGRVSVESGTMEASIGTWSRYLRDDIGGAINWVIAGGESGPGYRPMNLDHARQLRDECEAFRIPFWFKQVGGQVYVDKVAGGDILDGVRHHGRPTP